MRIRYFNNGNSYMVVPDASEVSDPSLAYTPVEGDFMTDHILEDSEVAEAFPERAAALRVTQVAALRAHRDQLLTQSDWTQMPDSPLDATTKSAWSTYRTALRNLPDSANFATADLTTIVWPTPPE